MADESDGATLCGAVESFVGSTESRPTNRQMKHAVVLLSGGIDSATTLAIAISQSYEAWAMSFDYGQRHRFELEAARRVANSLGAKEHRIVKIDNSIFSGSALTNEIEVPKQRSKEQIAAGIPITYVPARNTIFLAHALAWAEMKGAGHIFIGVNAIDYSGYPDCRPEFIAMFEMLANLGTRAGVEGRRFQIHAPLIQLSKAEIIRRALELNVDLSLTHSCYDPTPDGRACGECDSCQLRLKGFREVSIRDPIRYAQPVPVQS
jgi:7-cyano-7-deazaguanine synthase